MQKLNEKSMKVLLKLIEEELHNIEETVLSEAPIIEPQAGSKPIQKKPVTKQAPVKQAPVKQAPVKQAPVKQQAPVQAVKPVKSPQQQKLDAERSRPPKPKVNSDVITRVQYQIFTTKLAMSRLDTNILSQKFTESLHEFDLKISKNDKDTQKINAYTLPVIGSIEALKNALEALQIEFDKLKTLVDKTLNV